MNGCKENAVKKIVVAVMALCAMPSRGSLLHKVTKTVATAICALGFVAFAKADAMLDSIEQGNAQLRRLVQEIVSSGQAKERARQIELQRAAARANNRASSVPVSVTAGSVPALTLGELPQAALDRGTAIKNGNWERAVYISRRMLLYNRGDDMAAPLNAVTDYVYLFFCHWNMGNKTQACDCLREGIDFMKSRFGNDCDSRARVLLAKAESGELSGQFTYNDIMGSAGIGCFILELPTAVSDRHHAALMNQIQASTDFYRKEGEWQATHAKFQAKREYEDKYHRSFDPNDRPPEGSRQREDWDSCKRIYDIFDMSH